MSENMNSTELPDNEIVGYLSNKKSVTKEEFIKRIENAEAEIKKGQYITLDALKDELNRII